MRKYKSLVLFFLLMIMPFNLCYAGENDWALKKDRNGIKVYAKAREGSDIYMYKVVTSISAKPGKIYRQVVDFRENLQYMKHVDSLKMLDHQEDSLYRNYMHFNMPWPVKNRELIMEMKVQIARNEIYLESTNVAGLLNDKKGTVPVQDFREDWKIEENMDGKGSTVTVTGWIDSGGNIPQWVTNLFITKTPYRFISGIIQEVKRDQ